MDARIIIPIIASLLVAQPALARGGGGGGHCGGGHGGFSGGGAGFGGGGGAMGGGGVGAPSTHAVAASYLAGYGRGYGRRMGGYGYGYGGNNMYYDGMNQHVYVPPGPNTHDVDPGLPRTAFVQSYSWPSSPTTSNTGVATAPSGNTASIRSLAGHSNLH